MPLSKLPKRRKAVTTPSVPLKSKPKTTDRRVFLTPEVWADLTATAKFHTLAFKEMGHKQSVSRNDVIESFVGWALEEFWRDKGGRPANEKEALEKARRWADRTKK